MTDINKIVKSHRIDTHQVRRIFCPDGFTMSVQASHYTYCSPRYDNEEEYSAFEVGFPSEKEDLLMEYAEDPDRPTDTVYGWVPAEVLDRVIEKHGGVL